MEAIMQEKIKNVFFNFTKKLNYQYIEKNKTVYNDQYSEEILRENLIDALDELSIAESNFHNAEPEFIEIANEELTIANKKVDVTIKKIKKLLNLNNL